MPFGGGEWGSRQEMLHPRDSKGRFRSSWKMATSVVDKIQAMLERGNPKLFTSDQEAQTYVHTRARADRYLTNRKPAIDRFLKNFSKVNGELNAGNTSNPDVKVIDAAMKPLPDDLILTRTMSPESFGLNAGNIGQIEELTGKLVTSKGYTPGGIGTPFQRQPGTVTMTIATPAGTKAVIPNLSSPSKEIILDRGQPLRITKVDPDGQGGFNILAVASGDSEGETPVDLARAVPGDDVQEAATGEGAGVPATTPAAPGAPAAAPVGPAPGAAPAAPVRTGRPGRPAGPGPAARNDGHVVDSVGTGQAQSPSSAPATPAGSAPQTPETPPVGPEVPNTPEPGADPRATFRKAFEEANLKVPSVGTRRKQYETAYRDLASGKKTPQEVVRDLDDAIALNKRVLASDKEDGTDSGPLPEDIKRQEALSDLIKEEYNFTGRKTPKETPAAKEKAPAKKAPAAAAKAPAAKEPMSAAEADRLISEGERKRKAAIRKEVRAKAQPVKRTEEQEATAETARKASESRAATQAEADAKLDADAAKVANGWLSDAGVKDEDLTDFQKTGLKLVSVQVANGKISRPEAARRLRNDNPTMAKIADAIDKKSPPRKTASAKEKETPTDIDKMTVAQLRAEAKRQDKKIPSKLTRKADIAAFLKGEKEAPLSVREEKALATGNNGNTVIASSRDLESLKEKGLVEFRDVDRPSGRPAAFLTQKGWDAAGFKGSPPSAKKAETPAEPVKRPQIPAKDLSDKGLLSRFEAEIKKDNPDEVRLKELGDELDRRDLESTNRVKALTDDDLEAQFQDAIRADELDQDLVDRLGAEMDRRDREAAANQAKVDALVVKGREYRDAWAEVHGKDPEQLKLEEKRNLIQQARRPGETVDGALRRLHKEDVHRQYLDAEKVTRGHLLTPEGRARGIDAKSLFQGSGVTANKWASDELKEYWETNPRKNFIQFKAEMLGRDKDVAAAKKSEGIQRTLELGEALKRKSPQKKTAATRDKDGGPTPAEAREQERLDRKQAEDKAKLERDQQRESDRLAKEQADAQKKLEQDQARQAREREAAEKQARQDAKEAEVQAKVAEIVAAGREDDDNLRSPNWTITGLREFAKQYQIRVPATMKDKEEIRRHLIEARLKQRATFLVERVPVKKMLDDAEAEGIALEPSLRSPSANPQAVAEYIQGQRQLLLDLGIDRKAYKPQAPARRPFINTGGSFQPEDWDAAGIPSNTDPNHPVLLKSHRASGYESGPAIVMRRDRTTYVVEVTEADIDNPYVVAQIQKDFLDFHASTPGASKYQHSYSWFKGSNPSDDYWNEQYKTSEPIKSLAAAGGGVVMFYNRSKSRFDRPNNYPGTLQHELGHNVDSRGIPNGLFGSEGPGWKSAAERDHIHFGSIEGFFASQKLQRALTTQEDTSRGWPFGVTKYGKSSPVEDYAESLVLFTNHQPLGTGRMPGESRDRQLYFIDLFPERAQWFKKEFPDEFRKQMELIQAAKSADL